MSTNWITFDCYGTLLDWQTAFRRVLGPDVVHAYHEVEPAVEAEMPTASYKAVIREAVSRAGGDGEAMIEQWHTITAFPDTPGALQRLKDAGWKIGILTNCDNDLFESTRAALGVEIDLVVTAEEVHSYKPALGHFERFEQRSGVAREDWVHAAVAWWHDMVPAQTLGLRRYWVDREDSGHDASIVTARVTDMAGLAELLA